MEIGFPSRDGGEGMRLADGIHARDFTSCSRGEQSVEGARISHAKRVQSSPSLAHLARSQAAGDCQRLTAYSGIARGREGTGGRDDGSGNSMREDHSFPESLRVAPQPPCLPSLLSPPPPAAGDGSRWTQRVSRTDRQGVRQERRGAEARQTSLCSLS